MIEATIDPEVIDTGPQLVQVDAQELINSASKDLNIFASLCSPDSMLFLFPKYFLIIWNLLLSKVFLFRDFSKLAIGIPRGFAKTTVMKLFIAYVVIFTNKRCVVVVSYKEDHAINIIKDVIAYLENPNIVALFGRWDTNVERNVQDCKIFHFRGRQIVLAALGSGGSIRGLNIGDARPDVMIFEDFQKKDESENVELSNNLYKDMMATWVKAKSPFGCLYVFVANMYPTPGSILKKLKNNPDWISLIVGGILSDGTSLWEDLQPIKQLLEEYQSDLNANCPEVFLSEVLNDENAGIKAGIDLTKLPEFPYPEEELPQGRAIVIDPATDKPKADYNGVGLVGLFDGKPALEEVVLGKFDPLELIKQAILLAFRTGTRLICVEDVAYQSTLLFWFNKICMDNSIEGFHFMPLKIGRTSKNGKIKASLLSWQASDIWVKKAARPFVINEVIKWNPGKTDNEDTVLDLLTFSSKVYEQHGDLMLMPHDPLINQLGTVDVLGVEENCNF